MKDLDLVSFTVFHLVPPTLPDKKKKQTYVTTPIFPGFLSHLKSFSFSVYQIIFTEKVIGSPTGTHTT